MDGPLDRWRAPEADEAGVRLPDDGWSTFDEDGWPAGEDALPLAEDGEPADEAGVRLPDDGWSTFDEDAWPAGEDAWPAGEDAWPAGEPVAAGADEPVAAAAADAVAATPVDGDAAGPDPGEARPADEQTWPEAAAAAAATIAAGIRVGLTAIRRLVADLRAGAADLRLGERPRAVRLAAGASAVVLVGVVALALGGAALGGREAAPEVTPRVTNGPVAGAEAAAVVDRFLASLEAPRSYEARMRGTVERARGKVRESLTGKVAGSAYDVRLRTTRADGTATEVRVVVRGKGTWIRRDDRPWSRPKARPANLVHADVFRGLASPSQLLHLGVEQRRGHVTHHLRTSAGWTSSLGARWIAAYPEAVVDRSTLDIWVLPDGRPIEVAHAFAARWPAPFVGGTIVASSTWVILRYGEPVTVTPPR